MPFKLHSKGRRHIPPQHHRVTNWHEYDASLRNRGSLAIWFTPEAIAGWKAQPQTQLWLILGDGVNQAADLASGATSIPSWNLTPWMTFGNWF